MLYLLSSIREILISMAYTSNVLVFIVLISISIA